MSSVELKQIIEQVKYYKGIQGDANCCYDLYGFSKYFTLEEFTAIWNNIDVYSIKVEPNSLLSEFVIPEPTFELSDYQLLVAIEELAELQQALVKLLRGRGNRENVLEEFADVLIVLNQVKKYCELESFVIQKIIEDKTERTINRIKNGERP